MLYRQHIDVSTDQISFISLQKHAKKIVYYKGITVKNYLNSEVLNNMIVYNNTIIQFAPIYICF